MITMIGKNLMDTFIIVSYGCLVIAKQTGWNDYARECKDKDESLKYQALLFKHAESIGFVRMI